MKPATLALLLAVLILPSAAIIYANYRDKKAAVKTDLYSTQSNPSEDGDSAGSGTPAPADSARPATDPKAAAQKAGLTVPDDAVSATRVVLNTTKGNIRLSLYPQEAPLAVLNFVTLGQRGSYNNIIFHRVIRDFMIQAGDPTGTGRGGSSIYGRNFPNEQNKYKYVPGTLGMANAGRDTNGSQFFIVTEKDQPSLNGGYTIFGQADNGSMDVVRAIAAVPTDAQDKPLEEVKITGFTVEE
jgi:cyclophilin family peptidyl-prolyl cis-trans isomerase